MLRRNLLLVAAVLAIPIVVVFVAIRLSALGGGGKSSVVVRLAGPNVDVTRAPGPQSEAAIAVDPDDPRVLIAGSNDVSSPRMRAYTSTDGGSSWRSEQLPRPSGTCGASDPSVAIDRRGREYFGFLGVRCRGFRKIGVYVTVRGGPRGSWRVSRLPVARLRRLDLGDDRPQLTIDLSSSSPYHGSLYVGWTRFSFAPPRSVVAKALVSRSDDAGLTWTRPTTLSTRGSPIEVRLATGPQGRVYATWRDAKTDAIYVSRSYDGATSFLPQQFVAGAVVPRGRRCRGFLSRLPAQPVRCVSPNPVVSVDTSDGKRSGRVYVTYMSTALDQSQDVYVAAYDADLHALLGVGRLKRVNPDDGEAVRDQFLPASAVDPESGRLWVCYYASGLGRRRRQAWYTCTTSRDGGRTWARPLRVATAPSDETVRQANRTNGFGDYEGVAAANGVAHAIWTDGRLLPARREEIFAARLR